MGEIYKGFSGVFGGSSKMVNVRLEILIFYETRTASF